MSDFIRQHRKKLLQSLAPFVGSETGLLHLSSHLEQDEKSDVIPTALNLTYFLFLLRTKERPYMEKALSELKHLLFFQSSHSIYTGNFPTYLHQFPYCDRQFEVLECLYPLYWILMEFQSIMDASLIDQIKQVVYLALNSLFDRAQSQSYSFRLSLQLGILYEVFGKFYENKDWIALAEKLLTQLSTFEGENQWGSPRELSRLLLACSLMSESQIEQFSHLISHFEGYWHKDFCAYVGPAYQEFFLREKSEETLYHLFMKYKTQNEFPLDASILNLLNAELFIASNLINSSSSMEQGSMHPLGECLVYNNYSVSWMNWKKESWVKTGGVYPFKLLFQDSKRGLHSFVMQMGSYVSIQALSENEFVFEFHPNEDEDLEIEFFWDLAANAAIRVHDKSTSMFEATSACHIQFDQLSIILQVIEGRECLWGQLLHKDRKSQLFNDLHHSYDKHLYYRSTRSSNEKIKIKLSLSN